METSLDFFFEKASKWQNAYKKLREIALSTGLKEELKWGKPCYTYDGANVFLIHGFKEYCAVLFHKGALLKDKEGILIQQTENVQAARQLRFETLDDIFEWEDIIRKYMLEAIDVEKAGLKVELKQTKDYPVPEEFQLQLDENPDLKKAFESLTPGRQRGYLFNFGQPKQSKTRAARVEKAIPKILAGKGLDD